MMGLLGQPYRVYRVKKEIEKELSHYATTNNVELPNTLELKNMPAELGLDACLDSQNRNNNRPIVK